jgi:metal-responsive CopG/Arc/MetJ family transcriptional regulator
MPRPGPRMPTVSVRMPDEEIAVVDGIAERERMNRSEAARLLVTYAAPRMPEGWRPEEESQP